jgi:hypothetical protein
MTKLGEIGAKSEWSKRMEKKKKEVGTKLT